MCSCQSYEVLTLYADGPYNGANLSRINITIQFLPRTCPFGFQPQNSNDTTCECQCHQSITDYVCMRDNQTGHLEDEQFHSMSGSLTATLYWLFGLSII